MRIANMEIEIRRKPAVRNITVTITHEGRVRVSAPENAPESRIVQFVESKRRWIERKLKGAEWHAEYLDPTRRIFFRGIPYDVRWLASDEESPTVFFESDSGVCTASTVDGHHDPALLGEVLARYAVELRQIAFDTAAARSIAINRVYLRNQRTRWGSSSSRKNLSLNWRLIMAPPPVATYLILHELAHQRIMNHSRDFWRLVGDWCPKFAEHDAWLRSHAFALTLFR